MSSILRFKNRRQFIFSFMPLSIEVIGFTLTLKLTRKWDHFWKQKEAFLVVMESTCTVLIHTVGSLPSFFFFYKVCNFCDFQFACLLLSEKGFTLKRKNFLTWEELLSVGVNSSCQGQQNNFVGVYSEYISLGG